MDYLEMFRNVVNDLCEQSDRKEAFRLLHKKASNINEDVMAKYYGIYSNKNKPVLVEGITLDRIIYKHGKNGLIGISANRTDMPQERNIAKTKELISDIQKSGFSYLPTYGGYRSPQGVEDDYEPSFIVFNYTNDGEKGDFDELRNLAILWCGKYEQHSVLVKAPNANPIYLDKNGNKVNTSESDKVWKNDPKQPYFTSIKSKEKVDQEIFEKLMGQYKTYCHKNNIPLTKEGFHDFYQEHLKDINHIGKRITYDIRFDECYVNPMPCQLSERMKRKNEIMIWE